DWITTVTHYDKKSRPIYVYSKNAYLDTEDRVKSQLTFDGMVTETTTVRQKTGQLTLTIVDRYLYDHVNRPLGQLQKVNGAALDEAIVRYIYDDLGQLERKDVGGKWNDIDNLQNVDYSYSVRGWLRAINNPDITGGNDLFAFGINYSTQDHGGTPLYNGNIAETEWRTKSDNTLRWYRYGYDDLNRLKFAYFNSSSNDQVNWYNESNITYDKNGNLLSLNRTKMGSPVAGAAMDYLSYTYGTGNKLLRVEEQYDGAGSFEDGTNSGDDYTYDANGNMVEDLNKGISRIDYNHLNLPTLVYLPSGTISYIYDATGIKQKKIVSTGTTTEYAGNFIYEDGSFKMMSHPEGYAELRANAKIPSFDYAYQYKDHLGNVRLTYADSDGDGSIDAQTEIIEENNYYPFG
ncbi:RHS repeat-associated core domain-containing protein, partial [Winogradskyella sp. WHY3]|nr:RHS repeat-associated core domain-containing protein [Winogradskyella luteola]